MARTGSSAVAGGEGVEFTAELTAAAAEALRLEIRRLAARHGLELGALRVERLAASQARERRSAST